MASGRIASIISSLARPRFTLTSNYGNPAGGRPPPDTAGTGPKHHYQDGLARGKKRRTACRDAIERDLRKKESGDVLRGSDRVLGHKQGRRDAVHRLSGGAHPGAEDGAVRRFLMMRVMRFVGDRLGRGEAADDHNGHHEQKSED
ncbi:hypothetical protein NITMOv2_0548 [Nitrospira moscoviensis]|uniref:Uncharacterized protein n=1 Tax=Nitrospira moscoviensis TaxID=42253 RepID=A0A0K2G7S8_NITMO|nr:hypothetical protein NITMOv2_0548 [Nitrospira moscoviensis]